LGAPPWTKGRRPRQTGDNRPRGRQYRL